MLGQTATGAGIRRYPYSFDMTIDPASTPTAAALQHAASEVHDAGEIWCLGPVGHELAADRQVRLQPDHCRRLHRAPADGGNNLALQLVMEALKLQPANPSFLQARDAICRPTRSATGGPTRSRSGPRSPARHGIFVRRFRRGQFGHGGV